MKNYLFKSVVGRVITYFVIALIIGALKILGIW